MKFQFSVCFFLGVILAACNPISERKQPPPTLEQLATTDLKLDGEQLANAYCGSCHLKPDPNILDQKTWVENVLPDMRKRLGLYLEEDFGVDLPEDVGVPKGIYAKVQLIQRDDWQKILQYYQENAPKSPLPQLAKKLPKTGIPGFDLIQPEYDFVYPNLTTMIRIHPETGQLWLGNRFRTVFVLDPKNGFQRMDSIATSIAPVEILWNSDSEFELLTMGLMDPSNDSIGSITKYNLRGGEWVSQTILDSLMRPVHFLKLDLNGGNRSEYVISQFGNHLGKLSLNSDSQPEKILSSFPGARRTISRDLDQDGDKDLIVQMTQSRESIRAFINDGKGDFREKILLEFHPAFGSSDFRLEDMNGDGLDDIILVNGDNADQSQILKNYHGVRIFLNDGENNFEESWFYPMYGASGLEVDDFDGDGDLDLFAIAFFPDPKQRPRQDLIYFRQESDGDFSPFVLARGIDSNWLTITKGDLDLDGDQDVVVGSFEFNDLYKRPQNNWKPFIILKNLKK
jgi:hypothetical protein